MNIIETQLPGLLIIEPKVFGDSRGYFVETYKQDLLEAKTGKINFIQDNESKSSFGVLRGLHYQIGEFAQAKLVRVICGSVLDVAVDIRKSSPTFGQHIVVELSEENKKQLFIPRGFAHGFLVTSSDAIFVYKVDNKYAPTHECSIIYNDPKLGINWGIDEKKLNLSPKDLSGVPLKDAVLFD
jgi:dTDP-4-dehydrorhamnose 3,5-epimerase